MADEDEFWNEEGLIDRDEDQYGHYDGQEFDSDEPGKDQLGSRENSTLKHSVSTSNGSPSKKASQQGGRRRTLDTNKHNFKQLYGYPKTKPRPRPADANKPRQAPVFVAEMLGEKRFEVDTLRNEISDLKFDIAKLKEENRTLRNQLRLQEKSLQKLDHEEANFGGYMKKFQDELRVQQELSRRYREEKMKLEHILRERDADMERNRTEMAKLRDIIAAEALDDRSTLASKLQAAEHERAVSEKRLAELQKHAEHLEKNHKFQLQTAIKRQKEADRRADHLHEENRKLRFEVAEKTKMLEIQNIYSKRHANILRVPHYLPELNDATFNDAQKVATNFDEAPDAGTDEEEEQEEVNGADSRHSDASARIKFDLEEEMDEPYRPPQQIETAVQQSDYDLETAEKAAANHVETHVNGRPLTGFARQELDEPPQPAINDTFEQVRPKSASRNSARSREQTEEQLRVDNERKKRLLAALRVIDTTGSDSPRDSGQSSRNANEFENDNGKRQAANEFGDANGENWNFLTAMAVQEPVMPSGGHHLLDSLEFAPPPPAQPQNGATSQAKPPKASGSGSANSPSKAARARLTPKEYSFVRAVESMHLGLSAAEEHSENHFNARYNAEKGGKLLPKRVNREKPTSLSFNADADADADTDADADDDDRGAHMKTDFSARRAFNTQNIAKSLDTDDVEEINM